MTYRFNLKKFGLYWPLFTTLAIGLTFTDQINGVFGGIVGVAYGIAGSYVADLLSREPIPVEVENDAC